MRFGVLLLLTFLVLPAAQAQQQSPSLSVVVDFQPNLLTPDVEVGEIQVEWHYQFQNQAQAISAAGSETTLHWNLSCASLGIQLSGPRDETIAFPVPPTGMSAVRGETRFQVTATREVLALQAVPCQVTAYADSVNVIAPATSQTAASFTVAADYAGHLQATPRSDVASGAPGEQMVFQVDVANLGNAATRVQPRFTSELPQGWFAILPAEIVLRSSLEGRDETNQTMQITVIASRTATAQEAAVRLSLTPFALQDSGASGPPVEITLLARVVAPVEAQASDSGKVAPGTGPLLLAGLLALALVVRRRS